MPNIKIENVCKKWGHFYGVDNVSLDIEDNSFVTLLGPSGCGKTTILRMIAGLDTPTSGRITIGDTVVFDDKEGINIPANKRKVGFLFQNYALWPNMTVYKNIAFGLENMKVEKEVVKDGKTTKIYSKLSKGEIGEIVDRVSKVVKILPFMDRYPAELSGGQQQRVAIARTLAPSPSVLFMDEPLSNLDAKLRLEMRYELQRLHLETGSTFVYVTHDQMEAMTLATKICLMSNGTLQMYDKPLKVYSYPTNLFTSDFVGSPSINFIDAEKIGENSYRIFNKTEVKFTKNNEFDREINPSQYKREITPDKENKDIPFDYHIQKLDETKLDDKVKPSENHYIFGIRPEDIILKDDGEFSGEVYASLPTGAETTLKIKMGEFLLTSVIFGNLNFKIGTPLRFDIKPNSVLLFESLSQNLIAKGSV